MAGFTPSWQGLRLARHLRRWGLAYLLISILTAAMPPPWSPMNSTASAAPMSERRAMQKERTAALTKNSLRQRDADNSPYSLATMFRAGLVLTIIALFWRRRRVAGSGHVVHQRHSAHATLPPTPSGVESKSPQAPGTLSLPGDLAGHFRSQTGERTGWYGRFAKSDVAGACVVTSHRWLAVQHWRRFGLAGFSQTLLLQEQDVTQIYLAEAGRSRYSGFLAAAALTVLWFPLGTSAACLFLGLYLAVTRPELVIAWEGARHSYPLSRADQQRAITALMRAKVWRAEAAVSRPTAPNETVKGAV